MAISEFIQKREQPGAIEPQPLLLTYNGLSNPLPTGNPQAALLPGASAVPTVPRPSSPSPIPFVYGQCKPFLNGSHPPAHT